MKKYQPVEAVELFHLHFLEQLSLKLDKKLYAVKGGCNLRFFLKSIRYSQDMDIDVQIIQKETLANIVRKILKSTITSRFLKAHQLEILKFSEPKQTQTTQRWKILLKLESSSVPLNTKIEFSRRGMYENVEFSSIDTMVISKHHLNPIFASHYPLEGAYVGKLQALIGRSETQARDVFDLFHLIQQGAKRPTLTKEEMMKIENSALSLSFEEYKSQVVAFLPLEYQDQFGSAEFWDQMVFQVLEEVLIETC